MRKKTTIWTTRVWPWIVRHRGPLAVTVIIAVLLSCFAVLASEVAERETDAFDRAVLLWLRQGGADPLGPPWLERAVLDLSALGSGAVATVLVIIAAGFFVLDARPRQAALLAACTLSTWAAIAVLKQLYGRPRPAFGASELVLGLSFPSGHTMIATALYLTLGAIVGGSLQRRRLRYFVYAVAAVLAALVGVTRVYLGVHHPTDVLAGWTLGLAWALSCGLANHLLREQRVVEAA